jgi:hypothetical protein
MYGSLCFRLFSNRFLVEQQHSFFTALNLRLVFYKNAFLSAVSQRRIVTDSRGQSNVRLLHLQLHTTLALKYLIRTVEN